MTTDAVILLAGEVLRKFIHIVRHDSLHVWVA